MSPSGGGKAGVTSGRCCFATGAGEPLPAPPWGRGLPRSQALDTGSWRRLHLWRKTPRAGADGEGDGVKHPRPARCTGSAAAALPVAFGPGVTVSPEAGRLERSRSC